MVAVTLHHRAAAFCLPVVNPFDLNHTECIFGEFFRSVHGVPHPCGKNRESGEIPELPRNCNER